MDKDKFRITYEVLSKLHSDFIMAYPNYMSGRNKEIRKIAERNVESAIAVTKINIERNSDVFKLFAESKFGEPYANDEFYQARYFGRDMSEFLRMIKAKLDSDNIIDN